MSKVQYVWLSLVILTVAVEAITLRGLEEVPTTGEELRALEEVPTASNDDREEQDNDGGSFAKPALPVTIEDDCLNPGPSGFIFHQASGKPIHPEGGSANPSDNTRLVIHEGIDSTGRLNLRFVPAGRLGKYGYIQHVASGQYVHPRGGSCAAGDNTELIYYGGTHEGTLFAFSEGIAEIVHYSGRIWHPAGGATDPGNNTPVVVHVGTHAGSKFYFGDISGNQISPYNCPCTY